MCGWNQNRGGGKRYMWRIDTERSVSKSDKSNKAPDIIPMTGRLANGMNTTQFPKLTSSSKLILNFIEFDIPLNTFKF